MDWEQMKGRCPSARFVEVAMLPDHRLAFTRRSIRRGCGVADALREAGRQVWGSVFDISDLDVDALDQADGYRPGRATNSYRRRECIVFLDGDDRRPLTAITYIAEPQDQPPLPGQAYRDLIVYGARHCHLPDDYIAELERIEVGGWLQVS
jgi:hypothetical protein